MGKFRGFGRMVVLVTALCFAPCAMGDQILRRKSNGTTPGAPSADAMAAAAAAAAAQAAALRAQSPIRQALDAIRAVQAAQAAARTAAAASPGDVPDGLTIGGLEVAPGVTAQNLSNNPLWQGAALPVQSAAAAGPQVTVQQLQQQAVLTWKSFNIGPNTILYFDQSTGGSAANTWIALNLVQDPSLRPSQILGTIKAQGQVYVLNPNGILFGGTSQVNVYSLVVSSLDIPGSAQDFLKQALANGPVLTLGGDNGPAGPVSVAAGANITVGSYGQAVLVGGEVSNAGTIQAPDGQVLLGAGTSLTLVSGLNAVRGYAVAGLSNGGTVENTGLVSTPRGNITMVGDVVKQDGMLTATTSVPENGSIQLGQPGTSSTTLGPGSITQILPDDTGGKVVDAAVNFNPSVVSLLGQKVSLEDNASIYAPSGSVNLNTQGSGAAADSRIYVGVGADIDVSGLLNVQVPMSDNTLEVQLRANELADNPVLRDDPAVRGKTVFIDGRLGTSIANIAGYYALIPQGVEELMTAGGSVSLSANEVITRAGSVINLSGGSFQYQPGYVTSSVLIDPTGKRVRIEDAKPGVAYLGVGSGFVVDHARWGVQDTYASSFASGPDRHYEAGYVQGANAGTLTIQGAAGDSNSQTGQPATLPTGAFFVFDGQVVATTVIGPNQRGVPTASSDPTLVWRAQPSGATLSLNNAGDVSISSVGPLLGADFRSDTVLDGSSQYQALKYQDALPAAWFDGSTFRTVAITSGYTDDTNTETGSVTANFAPGGHLSIGAGMVVNLGDGGQFSFVGKSVNLEGTVLAPGGSVTLTALDSASAADLPGAPASVTLTLGATGVIDVAGRWTNGRLDGAGTPSRPLNGGTVALKANFIDLQPGSVIDVSGGASLDSTGTKVTAGNGGKIVLDVSQSSRPEHPQLNAYDGSFNLNGALIGYALGTGGALNLVTDYDIVIGNTLPAGAGPTARLFTPDFFSQGGFSSFSLVGERSVTVLSGTLLNPQVETWTLPGRGAEIPSGTKLMDFATFQVLPEQSQAPVKLALSTVPVRTLPAVAGPLDYSRDVIVETGATIELTPGSTLQLSSVNNLFVDGTLEAPGGTINLAAVSPFLRSDELDTLGVANVRLGPTAQLLAEGYVKTTLVGGRQRQTVEAAGTILLSAPHEVLIDPNAVLDVSGKQAAADLNAAPATGLAAQNPYVLSVVDGNAGTIAVTSNTGVLAGHFLLAPGGENGNGGSLVISKTGFGSVPMVVTQDLPEGFGPVTLPSPGETLAHAILVVASRINASGADNVTLNVDQTSNILFSGSVSLSSRRSLTLNSTTLGTDVNAAPANVQLSSAYVQLLGGPYQGTPVAASADLRGTLEVDAKLIDITNSVFLGCTTPSCTEGGFATAHFVASGDVRLSDHQSIANGSSNAGLFSNGSLAFDSAQVYVTQLADPFNPPNKPGFVVHSDTSITLTGNGNPAPLPLGYGETLTLSAPVIVQGGTLRVPQGQLQLVGTGPNGSVTLLPGSLTSTSLEGQVVPFGQVLSDGTFAGYNAAGKTPTKAVQLLGPNVAVQPGAVVDVSGGGDLVGYFFSPGNGGTQDILNSANAFAIVPSLGSAPAPAGGVGPLQNPVAVGTTVWLQGVPGLAAGFYTVLPAHDALLPGGLLIQPLGGSYASPIPASTRPDGATVASGYFAASGIPARDPGYGLFLVSSQKTFEQYSQITTYSFNSYARALASASGLSAQVPDDAGSVVLNASLSLSLGGTGRLGAGPTGALGNLDISAPNIAVVGQGVTAPDSSYIAINVQALEAFGAGSVLLGGTRSAATDPSKPEGTAVTVNAANVWVNTGYSSPWTAPEILLAAQKSVTVADGSSIAATGTLTLDTNPLLLQGDSAVLRLSAGSRVPILRTDTAQPNASNGNLVIGSASLASTGSLSFYGSGSIILAADVALSARQFDLTSAQVNLGDVPAGTPGTTLSTATIDRLASSGSLLLRGTHSIQLFGSLTLGSRDGAGQATLEDITLDTGVLQGQGTAGDTARLTAGTLTLQNSSGAGVGTAGSATLVLDVDALDLGPGNVQLAGYSTLQGRAGTIVLAGSGSLGFAGSVNLSSGTVQAASNGLQYALAVGGSLSLTRDMGTSAAPAGTGLGGVLSLSASDILLDTSVTLPSGTLSLNAQTGSLQLGPTAALHLAGVEVDFQDQARFAPGGLVSLTAAGDVSVAPGAVLDVSGAASGGSSGGIAITSGGTASLQGSFLGLGQPGFQGASFSLDAARLGAAADFSAVNAALETGGFNQLRDIRLRQQDITLAAGQTLTAHQVVLQSDNGQVTIAGTISAGGTAVAPAGGDIQLTGGNGVVITGTAVLDAHAAQPAADAFPAASGKVEVSATGGRVDVAPGSVIDVSGGQAGGGTVVVRALRDGSDVAVDELAGQFRGARQLIVQGVQDYQASVVDGSLVGTMLGDATTWLGNTAAIASRLSAGTTLPPLLIGAGISVASSGDLSIQSDVAVNGAFGAGYLGFFAAGKLTVGAAVSDGFSSASRSAALLSGPSSTIQMESGADIELSPNATVRTGTGDISLHAGRDIVLDDSTAVLYTAGAKTATPAAFLGAPAGLPLGEFPTQGGDVSLQAGRDVVALALPTETSSAWLFRYGSTTWNGTAETSTVAQQTSWSILYANFNQGVGALGGGEVQVRAGRDVVQLQVAIPTTGYLLTTPGQAPQPGDLVTRGGGNLQLQAGADILGGLFLLGEGEAQLRAGGSVVPSGTPVSLRPDASGNNVPLPRVVGVLFGLMDATASVTAGSSVDIEGAFDPMRQGQIAQNKAACGGSPSCTSGTAFWGYTGRTALDATALGGSVTYQNDPWASADFSLANTNVAFQVQMRGVSTPSLKYLNDQFSWAPPTLRLTSFESSVVLTDPFRTHTQLTLAPAAQGTLELLAQQNVQLENLTVDSTATDFARGPLVPLTTLSTVSGEVLVAQPNQGAPPPLHLGDLEPARLYALQGSVCAYNSGSCVPNLQEGYFTLVFPKALEVIAGQDVRGGSYSAQNVNPSDVTLLQAGRDIYEVGVTTTGGGSVVLQAGRNVVENLYRGGGLSNVQSPSGGVLLMNGSADLYVLAGMAAGVNYDAFAAVYLDPSNSHNVPRTYLPELAAYMARLGYGPLPDAQLVAAFDALPLLRREIFLDQVYFTELQQSGLDYNTPGGPRYQSYKRGFQAVSTLFPTDPATLAPGQGGDVLFNGKAEQSQQGSISVLAPYGRVAVGTGGFNTAGVGGIVSTTGGSVDVMANEDIDLFTSRVFTLDGGDITMWTSGGSITAGSGAKTSVYSVPISYLFNNAVIAVNIQGLQTGAGIGVLDVLGNASQRKPSLLSLIAPFGAVNAGDAGIRVVGNLNIAAQVVVGVDNIQATGVSKGIPIVQVPNVAALTSATQLATAAAKEGVGPEAQPRNTLADLPSIITVEAVGYEKKSDAPDQDEDPKKKKTN